MEDVIIIGAGPAGITAGIYCARKKLKTLVITKDVGGQAALSGDVENYTGYQFVTGPELAEKFAEHLKHYSIELKDGEEVVEVSKDGDVFHVKTKTSMYYGKTVILASGRIPRMLHVSGEKEYKNLGVTYCATCDAPLFHEKDVAVIGGGNAALDAVLQLLKIAKKVYVININKELTGDKIMAQKVCDAHIVEVINNAKTRAIQGEKFVNKLVITVDGKERIIPVQGIFIEIGSVANSDYVTIVDKQQSGEIKVDKENVTNIPGLFAAGDVTDVMEKQIIIAAGEGAKAALKAFEFLAKQKE